MHLFALIRYLFSDFSCSVRGVIVNNQNFEIIRQFKNSIYNIPYIFFFIICRYYNKSSQIPASEFSEIILRASLNVIGVFFMNSPIFVVMNPLSRGLFALKFKSAVLIGFIRFSLKFISSHKVKAISYLDSLSEVP